MSNARKESKIVREFEPVNLEFPFNTLISQMTPNDSFYVRNHFSQPRVDVTKWCLSIEGAVDHPFKIDYEELLSLPNKSINSLLECAGNSRVFLNPKASGAQWGLGAVGNAHWTGVSLTALLERAGLKESVIDLIFEGADLGVPEEKPKPKKDIHFARSLPKSKALGGDVLLAYQMNGETLDEAHGYPLRLIVPGWYGMASVKWLNRIVAADYQFDGYFQKVDYAFWIEKNGIPVREAISEIEVKSEIAQPAAYDVVCKGSLYKIRGAAWSGEHLIEKVEVSVNGGKSWVEAQLDSIPEKYSWVLWNLDWQTPNSKEDCVLLSRASDSSGKSQPLDRDPEKDSYRISNVLPVPVQVE